MDANFLLYAANADAPEHEIAKTFLAELIQKAVPAGVPWSVVYEFMAAATRGRAVPFHTLSAGEAQRFINVLLDCPTIFAIGPTNRHAHFFHLTLQEIYQPKGNFFHDVEVAVMLREHGIPEIITADTDFLKFPFLRVINPFLPRPQEEGEGRVSERVGSPGRRKRGRPPKSRSLLGFLPGSTSGGGHPA